ncbi:ACRC [Bugula neritina]|uniref:ACRC n=1 Tax=Bugula neritina TaxID=10212 RepID=A0A7J7KLT2_BUGNE|nr:ACRC [Bugula neritina]
MIDGWSCSGCFESVAFLKYWQYWARKSELTHKELPQIRRCHSYDITTKFIYRCTKCGQQVGRHSKSLDTATKVCGYCKGTFELLSRDKNGVATPAKSTPNKFAMFVKENYASVRKRHATHKDVMQQLSKEFSSQMNL